MTSQDGVEEIVVCFDDEGRNVVSEHRFQEFEAFTRRDESLDQFAASTVKASYAVVGSGLVVRGLVFFQFSVDEDGYVSTGFNLPLEYLLQNSGTGPDLGHGPVQLACRGQCPIPWHAINLWEPEGEGDENPAMLVQKSVWRNRLGLRPMGTLSESVGEVANGDSSFTHDDLEDPLIQAFAEHEGEPDEQTDEDEAQKDLQRSLTESFSADLIPQRDLENRLTETFGEEGKVSLENFMRQHNDQLLDAKQRFRDDLLQQQQNYLDQIRELKDEMRKLKVNLRHEQDRNRRLQELMRGQS